MKPYKSQFTEIENSLKEVLADYAHKVWSKWMKHLFSKGIKNQDGTFTINKDSVDRWERQLGTHYRELPEKEKESDRDEANKIISIINTVSLKESVDYELQKQIAQLVDMYSNDETFIARMIYTVLNNGILKAKNTNNLIDEKRIKKSIVKYLANRWA